MADGELEGSTPNNGNLRCPSLTALKGFGVSQDNLSRKGQTPNSNLSRRERDGGRGTLGKGLSDVGLEGGFRGEPGTPLAF